jgi:protein gp37
MNKTAISYLTHTWNPLAMKCTRVSEGCAGCWHLRMAKRHAANPTIPLARRMASGGNGAWLDEAEIDAPSRRRKPAIIGVQFMGDLWHSSVTPDMRRMVCDAIGAAPWHQYFMLTKRPGNIPFCLQPPQNVLVGISAENQEWLDRRWNNGNNCPTWISAEPILGPLSIRKLARWPSFVACGPETGPGARGFDPAWINALADECANMGIPFHDKRETNDPYFTRREMQT